MQKKLSKAEIKEMRELIKRLPDIVIIENGKVKYQEINVRGKSFRPLVPCLVDKEKFFTDQANKGVDPQHTVKMWMEKSRRNKAQVALVYKRAGDQSQPN